MEVDLTPDLTGDLSDATVGDKVTLEGTITKSDQTGVSVQIDSAAPAAEEEAAENPGEGGSGTGEYQAEPAIPGPVRTLLKKGK